MFAVNPDGAEYDLTGNPYREWRKNRQPNAGTTAVGTDINRNYGYHWACCGGSSGSKSALTYRGAAAFSTPEARAIRDFMASRRIDGRQQIKFAITFHTAGEQVLWPYGYTSADVPADMTVDDHAALVKIGQAMAKLNGYTPMQSSSLYVTDGDEIDWAYGHERIWMYTFEMYPSHSQGQLGRAVLPGRRAHRARDEPQSRGHLYLIERAWCPYARHRQGDPGLRAAVRRLRDRRRRGSRNPLGTDTATAGLWQRANPAATTRQSDDGRRPARTRSSRARPPARAPTRTTSTGSRASADRWSSSGPRPVR